MSIIDDVFSLVAKRDLFVMLRIHEIAKPALATADGNELLALHEAIVHSLDALLTELAEHGLQNQALIGIDRQQIDLPRWAEECETSWEHVKQLRSLGFVSGPLIDRYVGDWMFPIGSTDWLNQMRRSAVHRDAAWVARIMRNLARPT
jgi:hypothetical protein